MSEAVTRIVAQSSALSRQEKAELAPAVLLSLEPDDSGVEEAWDRELTRRIERIRAGPAVGIPAEQVFADWRRERS